MIGSLAVIGSLHVKHHINISTEHAPSEHLDVQGNNASIKYIKGRMQVGQVMIPLVMKLEDLLFIPVAYAFMQEEIIFNPKSLHMLIPAA